MNSLLTGIGKKLAAYLSKPLPHYEEFSTLTTEQLRSHLLPGDLLLVEGNSRISIAIKYLTQSTWSHVSLYLGDRGTEHPLLEADLESGVTTVPLEKYRDFNVRICRPHNLENKDLEKVLDYAIKRIGYQYDTRNIFDLMRYLIPRPPVPTRLRRHMIAFGSGDPTKAICSTLVAQSFQSVNYPILPRPFKECSGELPTPCDDSVLQQRHYTHFVPRDFDLSPYFSIIKPTLEDDFDYRRLKWTGDNSAQ